MESELNKQIETSTDEHLLIIKSSVDYYIVFFKEKYNVNIHYTLEERNELIMKVYELIVKKYLTSPNARWESDKKCIVNTIVQSYMIQRITKERKNLQTPN